VTTTCGTDRACFASRAATSIRCDSSVAGCCIAPAVCEMCADTSYATRCRATARCSGARCALGRCARRGILFWASGTATMRPVGPVIVGTRQREARASSSWLLPLGELTPGWVCPTPWRATVRHRLERKLSCPPAPNARSSRGARGWRRGRRAWEAIRQPCGRPAQTEGPVRRVRRIRSARPRFPR
jgi:hypothetical protein